MLHNHLNFGKIAILQRFLTTNRCFTVGKIVFNKPSSPSSTTTGLPDVPGLSEACVKVSHQPVGPGAAKDTAYKNPEYFSYDKTSYFEAEIEMLKYRCPQPSKYKPFYPNVPK